MSIGVLVKLTEKIICFLYNGANVKARGGRL